MDRALQMGKGCEDTCVPCKLSSKGDFSEDGFNNQVDGVTHSVDCQPLSPTIPVTAPWVCEQSGHGGRDAGCMESITWTSTHLVWPAYSCC